MDHYQWNPGQDAQLKAERGFSFEQMVMHIEK
jgi:hypothetical protein